MEKDIKKVHSHYYFIPDKIPIVNSQKRNTEEKYFVYSSSFAIDEPFDEIFELVKLLPKEYKFYWTGKIPRNKKFPKEIPNNLIFTDYISFEKYYDLISNASAILALTTESDCLQSAAYEALAVETPMVISDTEALRNYFSNAAIYTKHDPHQIKEKLLEAANRKDELVENIRKIKKIRDEEFDEIINKLISEVNNLS
jgi:glycosyltransferase involved in cell wall biosynthesis